jgi:hypothetical protein
LPHSPFLTWAALACFSATRCEQARLSRTE